jgi:predicted protein tyrosine phosphatase
MHCDVTDCHQLVCVPRTIATCIAARGGKFGVECDCPQEVFAGDATDTGSVSIGTNALTVQRLQEFDAVVSLCSHDDLPRDALAAWGKAHLHVLAEDTVEQVLPFEQTSSFLRQHRGQRRLVHCVVGASRSAATIAAWLIEERHCTLEQALADLRSVRPICAPNQGFMAQLERRLLPADLSTPIL